MSFLEDIYAQEDDGEVDDLERILENGDDPDVDGGDPDDEAEEEKTRVDPTKPKSVRVVKNPRIVLNPARLTGPRGISTINDYFKDFKFKGKGQEKEDLDHVMKLLEHWAHRLYPKFQFDDCLKKIELLGKKGAVKTHLRKLRRDMVTDDNDAPVMDQKDSDDEGNIVADNARSPSPDNFDRLLAEQIAKVRNTPADTPGSSVTPGQASFFSTPKPSVLTEEQKQRILQNRKLAEERRLAKLAQTQQQSSQNDAQMDESNDTAQDIAGGNVISTEQSVVINDDEERRILNDTDDTVTDVVHMTVEEHMQQTSQNKLDVMEENDVTEKSISLNHDQDKPVSNDVINTVFEEADVTGHAQIEGSEIDVEMEECDNTNQDVAAENLKTDNVINDDQNSL